MTERHERTGEAGQPHLPDGPPTDDRSSGPVRVVAIYPVRDFDEFCAQLARTNGRREELGVFATAVHRSVDNPNEVMVTFDVRSAEDALALFTADDRIRAWMDRAGVDVYPAVFVGTPVD